jgi:hypothetical protein
MPTSRDARGAGNAPSSGAYRDPYGFIGPEFLGHCRARLHFLSSQKHHQRSKNDGRCRRMAGRRPFSRGTNSMSDQHEQSDDEPLCGPRRPTVRSRPPVCDGLTQRLSCRSGEGSCSQAAFTRARGRRVSGRALMSDGQGRPGIRATGLCERTVGASSALMLPWRPGQPRTDRAAQAGCAPMTRTSDSSTLRARPGLQPSTCGGLWQCAPSCPPHPQTLISAHWPERKDAPRITTREFPLSKFTRGRLQARRSW